MEKNSVEKIYYETSLLAKIVRHDGEKGLNFYTDHANPLQLGIIRHSMSHRITPHIHRRRQQTIDRIQEVLYLESGKVQVDIYNDEENFVDSVILNSGDTIILMRGGHGFQFLEDSKLIYVKQGPYLGREEDKKLL